MARFNSRGKGSSFERKVAAMVATAFRVSKRDIYRTPLSGGHPFADKGDLTISPELRKRFGFCVECKHNRTWTPECLFRLRAQERSWIEQVVKASLKGDAVPLLVMRGNRTQIYCAFRGHSLGKRQFLLAARGIPHMYFHQSWVMMRFDAFLKLVSEDESIPDMLAF